MQFTKLFSTILESTIWQERAEITKVWITMLAMADRSGEVHASIPGLATRSQVDLDTVEEALAKFKAPDRYSRTQDHEGRRIVDIDGGWHLLNHGKYRRLLSAEERKEYNRRKQQEYRARKKASANVNDTLPTVTEGKHNPHSTEAEAEAEAEATVTEKTTSSPAPTQAIAWSAAKGWAGISAKDRKQWGEAYPACNLDRQLAAMQEWLLANPTKAKKKQWRRFLTNWLARAQERGGDTKSNNPNGSAPGGAMNNTPEALAERERALREDVIRI